MRLKDCLDGVTVLDHKGNLDITISDVAYDSRQVSQGALFVCIPGLKADGHDFAAQAVDRGAVALLVEKQLDLPVTQVIVPDCRKAMPFVAAAFFGHPERGLKVVGVTGTNGKTTVTHLIEAILKENGDWPALCGTLYGRVGDYREQFHHTTPESVDLLRFFREAAGRGASHLVMEVSSHALDLGRVAAIPYSAAVFTNLTQDHLDYHGRIEDYRQAKLKLFSGLGKDALAVINRDDPSADFFLSASGCRTVTYGLSAAADVRAENVAISLEGTRFTLVFPEGSLPLELKLVGMFSVYNVLAAAAWGLKSGIRPEVVKRAIEAVPGVAGRFETVQEGQPFAVVVDYAHTPDGLENVLTTARQLTRNRLITVFGCGGDRDRTKRPIMGEISARISDFTIVTSDNPRTEDPAAIIDDILPGIRQASGAEYLVEPDRGKAIKLAIGMAEPGDVVMIAGKGHEDYQIVGDKVLHFDDREVARECLRRLGEQSKNEAQT